VQVGQGGGGKGRARGWDGDRAGLAGGQQRRRSQPKQPPTPPHAPGSLKAGTRMAPVVHPFTQPPFPFLQCHQDVVIAQRVAGEGEGWCGWCGAGGRGAGIVNAKNPRPPPPRPLPPLPSPHPTPNDGPCGSPVRHQRRRLARHAQRPRAERHHRLLLGPARVPAIMHGLFIIHVYSPAFAVGLQIIIRINKQLWKG
jgi:hypothetical protein